MRRGISAAAVALLLGVAGVVANPAGVEANPQSRTATAAEATNFELVGHDPLFNRGMNSAPAIYGDYLYVGNRTDGSDECVPAEGVPDPGVTGCPHIHPGVLVVNIADPTNPHVVGEIGVPTRGTSARRRGSCACGRSRSS